jgi:MbtH protein
MANPFENDDIDYFALINDERQYSLWPAFVPVPEGWTVAHGKVSRQACLDYINENWTDMRPQSLVDSMNAHSAQSSATEPPAVTA